jgi:hypothetical protein
MSGLGRKFQMGEIGVFIGHLQRIKNQVIKDTTN